MAKEQRFMTAAEAADYFRKSEAEQRRRRADAERELERIRRSVESNEDTASVDDIPVSTWGTVH